VDAVGFIVRIYHDEWSLNVKYCTYMLCLGLSDTDVLNKV